jgi:hypothetical protein
MRSGRPGSRAVTWPARRWWSITAAERRAASGGGRDRADLELAFQSGPPLPEAPAGIRLRFEDGEQRPLAEALAAQERVAILVLDAGGAWPAQVELELREEARALIADASRGR